MKDAKNGPLKNKTALRYLYGFTIFILTLSGFGQMPIFKRYYIADIPGLGWLAQFYITHYLHYLGAVVFLGIAGYVVAEYLAYGKKVLNLTMSGYVRTAVLAGLGVSGIFLVVRNFSGVTLPPGLIIVLDLGHLSLVMLLLLVSGVCAFKKCSWVVNNKAPEKN